MREATNNSSKNSGTQNEASNGENCRNEESEKNTIDLQKNLGFFSAMAVVTGNVVGAGIFISPKGVLLESGSVGLSLIVWIFAGLLSMMASLTYAELGILVSESGGTYIYLLEGFAHKRKTKKLAWWRQLPAFIYLWQGVIFGEPAGLAIIAMTCAEYILKLFSSYCSAWGNYVLPRAAVKFIAVFIILLATFVNVVSIKAALRMQNSLTVAKFVALLVIIIGGVVLLIQGNTGEFEKGFEGDPFTFGGFAAATFSGLWAYSGWDTANTVAREIKDPQRNIPRVIISSLILIIFVYVMTNISFLAAMTTEEMISSETVAVTFGINIAGKIGGLVMLFSVVLSTLGTTLIATFALSRRTHIGGQEGHMWHPLSYIHVHYLSPAVSIIFSGVLAIILVIPADVGALLNAMGFMFWLSTMLVMIALFNIRKQYEGSKQIFRVPNIIPILSIILTSFLVILPIATDPRPEYIFSIVFLIIGFIFYLIFVHHQYTFYFNDHLTAILQKTLNVVPTNNPR